MAITTPQQLPSNASPQTFLIAGCLSLKISSQQALKMRAFFFFLFSCIELSISSRSLQYWFSRNTTKQNYLPKSQTLFFCFYHSSLVWRPLFPVVLNLESKPWSLEFRFGNRGWDVTFRLLSYLSSPMCIFLIYRKERAVTRAASKSDWAFVLCRPGLSAIMLCFRHGVNFPASARCY